MSYANSETQSKFTMEKKRNTKKKIEAEEGEDRGLLAYLMLPLGLARDPKRKELFVVDSLLNNR